MPWQYYEMSYGLNVEMHKQTEICKRLDAIIRQVLPFLNGEHQQQVAVAVERAKQITMTELTALMQVRTRDTWGQCPCSPQIDLFDQPGAAAHCIVVTITIASPAPICRGPPALSCLPPTL